MSQNVDVLVCFSEALAAVGFHSGMKHEQRRLQLYRQEVKLPHLRLISFTVLNIKKQFDSF